MTDMQTRPTSIRQYAHDLLPELCRLLAHEERKFYNNTDAISKAVERLTEELREKSDASQKKEG